MFDMRSLTVLGAGIGAVLIGAPGIAATTTFTGFDANTSGGYAAASNPNANTASAQFQSNLSGVSTESFESFATGTSAPLTLHFTGSGGTLTATLNGSGDVASATRSAPTGSGQFATDGSQYYEVESNDFNIAFGSAVAAFGFYATDIESSPILTFAHQSGASESFSFATLFPGDGFDAGSTPSGSVNFLGFINTADPFTSVTFGQGPNSSGDVLAFDQMTIGDARQVVTPPASGVPEPASWAMFIGGFGLVGGAMRRRRTTVSFA